MAVVNLVGSRIMDGLDNVPVDLGDPGEGGGGVKTWVETVEVGAADTTASTYLMARLPSNARILGASKLYWDDLTTTGSPTMDIGVYNQSGNSDFTDDPDAMSNAHDVTSAGSASAISDIANYGLPLWDFIDSQTTDPKKDLDIKVKLTDAAVAGGGTMTLELFYSVD